MSRTVNKCVVDRDPITITRADSDIQSPKSPHPSSESRRRRIGPFPVFGYQKHHM